MSTANSNLLVSLEPQLVEVLEPLPAILPQNLADDLRSLLASPSAASPPETRTIPYPLLSSISQWTRTPSGRAALAAHTPPLDPRAYEMIALLAGARTEPHKRFPKHVPQDRTDALTRKREVTDRKAITTLVNALLSIGGCGFATWYAAERLGWREEWKVLFALFVALVVAIAEGALYVIWQSRRTGKLRPLPPRRALVEKKVELEDKEVVEIAAISSAQEQDTGIQRRKGVGADPTE